AAAKYRDAYDHLIKMRRYDLLTRNQKIAIPGHINHSDDELAFLSYYPLLQYETDPHERTIYKQSLERSWQVERPERNPLWNAIYAAERAPRNSIAPNPSERCARSRWTRSPGRSATHSVSTYRSIHCRIASNARRH